MENTETGATGANNSEILSSLSNVLSAAQTHLAAISGHADLAAQSAKTALENQQTITATVALSNSKAEQLSEAVTQALASKTQITDLQTVIATKSDHIEQAQIHADKVRADLDRTLTAATQNTTETEGLKTRTEAAALSAAESLAEIKATKSIADGHSDAVSELHKEAIRATEATKELAAKALTTDERIDAYEKQLKILTEQYEVQRKTIIELLPGATSAGLASAFDKRRKTFLKPRLVWQWAFIISVSLLVVLAASGLWHVYNTNVTLSYDELLRLWLVRIPVAAALVWLALYAGRESDLAKRLEEDYGYKAAVASSFQGFHNQMSSISENIAADTPLAKLCADTLQTIGSPPGRIYNSPIDMISPVREITDAIKAAIHPEITSPVKEMTDTIKTIINPPAEQPKLAPPVTAA